MNERSRALAGIRVLVVIVVTAVVAMLASVLAAFGIAAVLLCGLAVQVAIDELGTFAPERAQPIPVPVLDDPPESQVEPSPATLPVHDSERAGRPIRVRAETPPVRQTVVVDWVTENVVAVDLRTGRVEVVASLADYLSTATLDEKSALLSISAPLPGAVHGRPSIALSRLAGNRRPWRGLEPTPPLERTPRLSGLRPRPEHAQPLWRGGARDLTASREDRPGA